MFKIVIEYQSMQKLIILKNNDPKTAIKKNKEQIRTLVALKIKCRS